jgi:hypothetical protein
MFGELCEHTTLDLDDQQTCRHEMNAIQSWVPHQSLGRLAGGTLSAFEGSYPSVAGSLTN